jgi:hypothetical protein
MSDRAERARILAVAARRRHDDAHRRAIEALRRLDASGIPISFSAVAASAGVSRAWLYRQADLRGQIDVLRSSVPHPARPPRPLAERASHDSLRERLEALRAREEELVAENARLRDALARNLGQRREAASGVEAPTRRR